MNKKRLAELLAKNPQVDKKALNETIKIVRDLRARGIKSKSVSALPPTDAYTSAGGYRISRDSSGN